jgi:hypothetical protein
VVAAAIYLIGLVVTRQHPDGRASRNAPPDPLRFHLVDDEESCSGRGSEVAEDADEETTDGLEVACWRQLAASRERLRQVLSRYVGPRVPVGGFDEGPENGQPSFQWPSRLVEPEPEPTLEDDQKFRRGWIKGAGDDGGGDVDGDEDGDSSIPPSDCALEIKKKSNCHCDYGYSQLLPAASWPSCKQRRWAAYVV